MENTDFQSKITATGFKDVLTPEEWEALSALLAASDDEDHN